MRALIVEDGESRGALAAARALGRAGWTVGVASPSGRGTAASSAWVVRRHRVPSPIDGLAGFLDAVADAVEGAGYRVVFAGGDAELVALAAGRDVLGDVVASPSLDCVLAVLDKLRLSEAARRHGIAVAETVEIGDLLLDGLGWPAIVKPRLQWEPAMRTANAKAEARVVAGPDEAVAVARAIRDAGRAPLLQRLIEGRLMAQVVVLDRAGRRLTALQQGASRIWPVGAGISARAAIEPLHEPLAARVVALLRSLGWFGLAEVQFVQPEGGEPHLLDVNGRLYGSLALAEGSGANVVELAASVATRTPPAPAPRPARGARYQWLEGDLRRAWAERRGGGVVDVVETMRAARGAAHSIWTRDDPVPALRSAASLGLRMLRAATRAPARVAVRRAP